MSAVVKLIDALPNERSALSASSGGILSDRGPMRQSYQPAVLPGAFISVTGTRGIRTWLRAIRNDQRMCGHHQNPAPATAASTISEVTICFVVARRRIAAPALILVPTL